MVESLEPVTKKRPLRAYSSARISAVCPLCTTKFTTGVPFGGASVIVDSARATDAAPITASADKTRITRARRHRATRHLRGFATYKQRSNGAATAMAGKIPRRADARCWPRRGGGLARLDLIRRRHARRISERGC